MTTQESRMSTLETREEILAEAFAIAMKQRGGVLATLDEDDATPYCTFVLFHLRGNGELLFGSGAKTQHSRNMGATPEVSFLIDTREVLATDWKQFDRVVIEGRAELVTDASSEYRPLLAEIATKDAMAATFIERGNLYRIRPRRLVLRKGIRGEPYNVEYGEGE